MVLSYRPSSRLETYLATDDASNIDALKLAHMISSVGSCHRHTKSCRAVQAHDDSNMHAALRTSAFGQTDALHCS